MEGITCSFCGEVYKPGKEINYLIGISGAICEECVLVAVDALRERKEELTREEQMDKES